MKKAFALLMLLVMLASPMLISAHRESVKQIEVTPDFRETLSQATLAIYAGKQVCGYKTLETIFGPFDFWSCEFKEQFVCTATVVDKNGNGTFIGLTTGHCFSYEAAENKIDYYVADNVSEKPVLHKIELFKFENDDRYDYGVFSFQSITDYPIIETYKGEGIPPIGTRVLNVNYSLGVTKEVVEGPIVSKQVGETESGDNPHLRRRYFVQIPFGPGASGSAIVDEETHEIVGLTEAMFPGTQMAAAIIPVGSNLRNFMQDDSAGLKPEPEPATKDKKPAMGDSKKSSIFVRVVMTFLKWFFIF